MDWVADRIAIGSAYDANDPTDLQLYSPEIEHYQLPATAAALLVALVKMRMSRRGRREGREQ